MAAFLLYPRAVHAPPPLLVCASSRARCALSKQGHRLLSSLDPNDPSTNDRLIRKFVASSSKSLALTTLSHLLSTTTTNNSDLSSFALPMYRRISETSWFKWNSKTVADVVALLLKNGQFVEAEMLISDSIGKLCPNQDITLFYCDLIESCSKQGLKEQVFEYNACLKQILGRSPATIRRCYKSMINGLCMMDLPHDAEGMLEEMRIAGFRPSPFEFRLVLLGYGRSGLFSKMTKVLQHMEDAGCALDTVCANTVLSCYGDHGRLSEMISWIRKMRELDIEFSVRTYNSVLNSCPTITSMLQAPKRLPLSIEGLVNKLSPSSLDEVSLIQELVSSKVLCGILEWSSSEGKLDLHGMHLGSAYLILLQWLDEMRARFLAGTVLPLEISVVCGLGKNRSTRGESPIKGMVSEMMFQMNSPLKIDRRNVGRFVARGKAVKDWLC
ncbi:hypothetical protein AAC387_Pa04g1909 [Persea americana]